MDKKYVFFLDIDGTLMNNGTVCMKNRTAISRARKAGHLVFINTARSYDVIPEKIRKMAVDGFVCSLGCNVIINKKTVYQVTMPVEEVEEICSYFFDNGIEFRIEGEDIQITNDADHNGLIYITGSKSIPEICKGRHIAKFFLPGVLPDEIGKYLSERYMFYQHRTYAEFAVRGNTKATAIEKVMEYLGIPHENSVAVGDSANDREMLESSGIAVVMGDGEESLKEIADIVTCKAADGGVADAIYRITGIEKPV